MRTVVSIPMNPEAPAALLPPSARSPARTALHGGRDCWYPRAMCLRAPAPTSDDPATSGAGRAPRPGGVAGGRPTHHAALAPLLVAAVLAGCPSPADDDDSADESPYHPPDQPGPWSAATVATSITSREGLSLPLQVWYPTLDDDGPIHVYDDLLPGGALDGAAPDCSQVRPVILFSHGNGGIRYQTWSVMERLATHGYVVAAPDHVDNTFLDVDDDLWPSIVMRRPWDVADAFDGLAALADGGGDGAVDLAGCVDADAGYAVVGHSFGAFTTYAVAGAPLWMTALLAACEEEVVEGCGAVEAWAAEHPGEAWSDRSDPRTWAAVPWAPAWHEFFGDRMDAIDQPIMVVGADRDTLTPWETAVEPSYRELAAEPRHLVGLLDAGHYSFTDMCGVLPSSSNGCGDDFRPADEVLETLATSTLAFLQLTRGQQQAEAWLPPQEGIASYECSCGDAARPAVATAPRGGR